ncbi:MAG TPA: sodium:calcium antiporter [Dehalococcoidia bacterium]|nr:sodium:calcium antiporter [Dehalococcoidia bacterium]
MRNWIVIAIAAAVALPGVALEIGLYGITTPAIQAVIFGVAIIGAAFLLSWAAEVLQLDVSQGLALGLLALIAVLPEYIVDATFAWKAAVEPAYAEYAVANMTGANRILIGIAWPLVVFIGWARWRQRRVELEPGHGLELVVLLVATVYAVIIPLKHSISLIDMVVLGAIFAFYIWRLSRLPAEPPHLIGPAETIGGLPTVPRRIVTAALALGAAVAILAVAEPFAEALIHTGTEFGIDEFLLVQWLAPLASEAPEFVVVSIFAWRGASGAAMGTLVSSKINQWTLLVGMLPLVYGISLGAASPLPLGGRQQHELYLTVAQTFFAVALMLDLRLHWYGAAMLFGLFVAGFVWPDHHMALAGVYVALAVVAVVVQRQGIREALRHVRGMFGQVT